MHDVCYNMCFCNKCESKENKSKLCERLKEQIKELKCEIRDLKWEVKDLEMEREKAKVQICGYCEIEMKPNHWQDCKFYKNGCIIGLPSDEVTPASVSW